MKNKFIKSMLLIICLLILFCTPVAATLSTNINIQGYISDDANVLTDEQEATLELEADRISSLYGDNLYFVTISDYNNYGHESIDDLAFQIFYDTYNISYGSNGGLQLVIVDVANSVYAFNNYGSYSEQAMYTISDAFYNVSANSDYFTFAMEYLLAVEASFVNHLNAQDQYLQQSREMLDNLTVTNVMDTYDLLTPQEEAELTQKAELISQEHGIETYILTIEDYNAILETYEIYDAATHFYTEKNLGYGDGKEGILLVLSMAERDFAYIVYGDYTSGIFDEKTLIDIESDFLQEFGGNYWFDGFNVYLDRTLFKIEYGFLPNFDVLIPSFIVALIVSIITGMSFKSKLNNVKKKGAAHTYVPNGGVNLAIKNDVFTHTTTSRTKVTSSSSSGGSSGSSHSGGGFSGRSGKF